MKILVAGWFSFENGHATAGDLLARDVLCQWLDQWGLSYAIALAPPFEGGVDVRTVRPELYSHLVFVCGPFQAGTLEFELLERFQHCHLIGIDLSMPIPLERWNPWDLLLERDSTRRSHPDLAFLSMPKEIPVIGICLVEAYDQGLVAEANAAIQQLVDSREMAVVPIDTRLDHNATGLRNPAEVEALIARMDVVVTTRLHGTVLALKNGVPALVIDPEAGGAKIRRQVETVGWPIAFTIDEVSHDLLVAALDYCLTEEARTVAQTCRRRALSLLEGLHVELHTALFYPEALDRAYQLRLRAAEEHSGADATFPGSLRPTTRDVVAGSWVRMAPGRFLNALRLSIPRRRLKRN